MGSEMCIRDSLWLYHKGTSRRREDDRRRKEGTRLWWWRGGRQGGEAERGQRDHHWSKTSIVVVVIVIRGHDGPELLALRRGFGHGEIYGEPAPTVSQPSTYTLTVSINSLQGNSRHDGLLPNSNLSSISPGLRWDYAYHVMLHSAGCRLAARSFLCAILPSEHELYGTRRVPRLYDYSTGN